MKVRGDAAVGDHAPGADATIPAGQQVQVLGDSAYGSGEMLAAIDAAGRTALVEPWPVRAAVDGGFTVDDFTVDEQAATVTCPAGVSRPVSVKTRQVTFGAAWGVPWLPAAPAVHPQRDREVDAAAGA